MKKRRIWILAVVVSSFFLGWLGVPRGLEGSLPIGVHDSVSTIVLAEQPDGKNGRLDTLYVGTRRGLYVSLDRGNHWRRVFRPSLWDGRIYDIVLDSVNPHSLIVAAGSGLFISTDGSTRWRRLLPERRPVSCVALDPRRPNRILIGTPEGLQISEDRGQTWTRLHRGLPMGSVRSIVVHPNDQDCYYSLSDSGLFSSRDGGTTWNRIWITLKNETEEESTINEEDEKREEKQPQEIGDLVIDPVPGALFLGTESGILVSRDEGKKWVYLPTLGIGMQKVVQMVLDPSAPGSLYVATGEGLFYLEAGKIWSPLRDGLPAGPVHAVALAGKGKQIWVGTAQGLFQVSKPERNLSSPPMTGVQPLTVQEPSVQEVQRVAVRYAEVMPEKIYGWRAGAIWRNLFPKLSLSLDRDKDSTVVSSTSGGKTTFSVGPEDESVKVGVDFTWDLANLIWNPDQTTIDARSRLMVQLRQDILEEVTRLYFERKRLLSEFQRNPTEDKLLQDERSLKIQELTAQLDALTGSWFSRKCRSPDGG